MLRYQTGETKTEYVYPNKIDTTHYVINGYYQNGRIFFNGNVRNGKFIGKKISYHENGKIKELDSLFGPCDLLNSNCDALVKRFNDKGVINQIFTVKNGKLNGKSSLFDSSGNLTVTYESIDGKKNGILISYFSNGVIASKENYKNDSVQDLSIHYNDKGDTIRMVLNNEKHTEFLYFERLKNGFILRGNIPIYRGYELWTWEDQSGKLIKRKIRKTKSSLIPQNLIPPKM